MGGVRLFVRRLRRRIARVDPEEALAEAVVGERREVDAVPWGTATLRVRDCTVADGEACVEVVVDDPARPAVGEYETDLRYVYTRLYEQSLHERLDPLVREREFDVEGDDVVVTLHVAGAREGRVREAVDRLQRTVERFHGEFHQHVRERFLEAGREYARGAFCTFDVGYEVATSALPDGLGRRGAAAYAGEYFEWRLRDAPTSDRDRHRSGGPTPTVTGAPTAIET